MKSNSKPTLIINISPLRIVLILGCIIFVLVLAHIAIHTAGFIYGTLPEQMLGLYHFFDMGSEANLPTYISALNLLFASGLLFLLAHHFSALQQKQHWYWRGLAIGFLLMSFDEATQIHEGIIGNLLSMYFGRGEGIMYYSWYKAYIPLILLVGFLYIPFFRWLPLAYLLKFGLAAVVFLGGAVGFEMLESYLNYYDLGGRNVSRLLEETSEMLGVIIFIYALLTYIKEDRITIIFTYEAQVAK